MEGEAGRGRAVATVIRRVQTATGTPEHSVEENLGIRDTWQRLSQTTSPVEVLWEMMGSDLHKVPPRVKSTLSHYSGEGKLTA